MTMQNNPWLPLLEDSDFGAKLNYFGRLPQNLTQQQFGQAQNLFQPSFNKFLGQLGQQLISGQQPTRTFTDYLTQDFNFERESMRLPQQRNLQAAPARFMFSGR